MRHLASDIDCITASLPPSWRSIKKPGPSTLRCACTLGGGNGVHRPRQCREVCRLLSIFLLLLSSSLVVMIPYSFTATSRECWIIFSNNLTSNKAVGASSGADM